MRRTEVCGALSRRVKVPSVKAAGCFSPNTQTGLMMWWAERKRNAKAPRGRGKILETQATGISMSKSCWHVSWKWEKVDMLKFTFPLQVQPHLVTKQWQCLHSFIHMQFPFLFIIGFLPFPLILLLICFFLMYWAAVLSMLKLTFFFFFIKSC